MTDNYDQPATEELPASVSVDVDVSAFESADSSMAAGGLPSVPDINLENAEKAAKWAWRHTLGEKHEKVEPGGINIDYEDEEETTMRSTWVEHDDPPPPPPPDEHPTHPAPLPHPAEHEKQP